MRPTVTFRLLHTVYADCALVYCKKWQVMGCNFLSLFLYDLVYEANYAMKVHDALSPRRGLSAYFNWERCLRHDSTQLNFYTVNRYNYVSS
jgi:hypothetical protein